MFKYDNFLEKGEEYYHVHNNKMIKLKMNKKIVKIKITILNLVMNIVQ